MKQQRERGRFAKSLSDSLSQPSRNGRKKRKAASKKVNNDNPYGLSDTLSKHEKVQGPRRAAIAAAMAVQAAAKAEQMGETEIETETETTVSVKMARIPWTPNERQRLVEGIRRYGKDNKKQLAALMKPRTYGAVERYIRNHWIKLEAEVKEEVEVEQEVVFCRAKWTQNERQRLVQGIRRYGKETLLIYIGWTRAHNFCGKEQNQNTKSSPKFGRPTYTIEIVTIK